MALVAGCAALALTACGDGTTGRRQRQQTSRPARPRPRAPAPRSRSPANPDFKACMVSDSGGFDDKGFNQTSHKGLTDAGDAVRRPDRRRSSRPVTTQYADNINQLVHRAATRSPRSASSSATPRWPPPRRTRTSTSRSSTSPTTKAPPPNLKGLTFDTDQPSYLAGYLAAGMSESRRRRHLRRPPDPDRDHLHGRASARASRSTTRTTAPTSSSSAGTARTARSPRTSRTRPRARRSASS